jgi:hypothetical protein
VNNDTFKLFKNTIHTLDMSNQRSITSISFSYLKGIHTLEMLCCNQSSITDIAFEYLKGIHTLNISGCCQSGITNNALSNSPN